MPQSAQVLHIRPPKRTCSPNDARLAADLAQRPHDVLERVQYARWRSGAVYGNELNGKVLQRDHFVRTLFAKKSENAPPWPLIVQLQGVAPLAALGECNAMSCNLNRSINPWTRLNAERTIAKAATSLVGRDGVLRLVFLHSGDLFTEVACLQQVAARKVCSVEVHFTRPDVAPLLLLAQNQDLSPELAKGYNKGYHDVAVAKLEQAAGWLATQFPRVDLLAYPDAAALQRRAQETGTRFHFFAALDPGLEPSEVDSARQTLRPLHADLGVPLAQTALLNARPFGSRWERQGTAQQRYLRVLQQQLNGPVELFLLGLLGVFAFAHARRQES